MKEKNVRYPKDFFLFYLAEIFRISYMLHNRVKITF